MVVKASLLLGIPTCTTVTSCPYYTIMYLGWVGVVYQENLRAFWELYNTMLACRGQLSLLSGSVVLIAVFSFDQVCFRGQQV